jgi:hypothetical protein
VPRPRALLILGHALRRQLRGDVGLELAENLHERDVGAAVRAHARELPRRAVADRLVAAGADPRGAHVDVVVDRLDRQRPRLVRRLRERSDELTVLEVSLDDEGVAARQGDAPAYDHARVAAQLLRPHRPMHRRRP